MVGSSICGSVGVCTRRLLSMNLHHHRHHRVASLFATNKATVSTLTAVDTLQNSIRMKMSLRAGLTTNTIMPIVTVAAHQHHYRQHRWMTSSSSSKPQDDSNSKKEQPSTNTNISTEEAEQNKDNTKESLSSSSSPFLQHQEWVKFQQAISVSGFQTGQVTTASVLKTSTRGGKQARKKREKELARLGAYENNQIGGGEKLSAVAVKFPAIRYSPAETDDLLKLAYETLPVRTGKRGTRNLRRQKNRWKTVRKIRSDYKAQLLAAHHRRMEYRKYKRERTKDAMYAAVDQRTQDTEYQGQILKRWTEKFHHDADGTPSNTTAPSFSDNQL